MSKRKKRFIAQVIPDKVWRKLGCSLRQAWNFMWINCDEAGVFTIDEDRYEFENGGDEFPIETIKERLSDFLVFNGDKILILDFIQVNYGTKLNPEYNPHKPLFRALKDNKLKLNPSLNQAYFKLIDEDIEEDVDEEEDKDEYFEKSEKLLNLNVESETLQSIDEIENQFTNEVSWKESICRNLSEVKNGFDMQTLENYLEQFFKLIRGDGEDYKTVKDTKKHFNRWLKIEIQKNKTNDKSNTEIFTDAMQSETAKQFRFK